MATVYRIGDLTLDEGRKELRRGAERIRIAPLTWRLLRALVDVAPNVISHDELADAVWGGRAVSPETISQRIKLLRRALGDDAQNSRYIELLRGHGYRLIPAVAVTAGSDKVRRSRVTAAAASLVIGIAALAALLLIDRKYSSTPAVDEGTPTEAAARPAPPAHSIAVLPFRNLSIDPGQEYFVAGMQEALISELARIDGLTVISGTSVQRYAATTQSLSEIARELNVATIVEGSVLRSADKVRIQIRLVGLSPERHLLAQTYDRDLSAVLKLQGEITRDIADKIKATLTARDQARIAGIGSVDAEAYTLWLKGNFHLAKLNEESFRTALVYYEKAIDLQPRYAAAYAGSAMAYMQLGSWNASLPPDEVTEPARKAAERALALDPALPEAWLALGYISAQSDWDWAAADHAFRQGVALNPSNTLARLEYANFLTSMGRFDESIEFGIRTLQLDPLSPSAYGELAFAYWLAGQDEKALELYREAMTFEPESGENPLLAELYLTRGEIGKALPHLPKPGGELQDLSPAWIGVLGRLYAMAGLEREARALLGELLERREHTFTPAVPIAYIHLGLGRNEEALHWLEVAYDEHDVSLIWLKVLPAYDGIRSSPRFQELLGKMKFPPGK